MMFTALSGPSPAAIVAIGSIVIAGMHQVGYSKEFSAGVIANAGTLGILIPPTTIEPATLIPSTVVEDPPDKLILLIDLKTHQFFAFTDFNHRLFQMININVCVG